MSDLEHGPFEPRIPSVFHGTNRGLMRHVARPYLNHRTIFDLTFGLGNWWTDDLHPDQCFTGNYTVRTLAPDRSSDVVVCDPAYVSTGTVAKSTLPGHHSRYGLDKAPSGVELVIRDMTRGLAEAERIARQFVMLKCQQQVEGATFHDVPSDMKKAAKSMGLVQVDEVIHERGLTAQPRRNRDGSLRRWVRTHRAHSHLLIFRVAR